MTKTQKKAIEEAAKGRFPRKMETYLVSSWPADREERRDSNKEKRNAFTTGASFGISLADESKRAEGIRDVVRWLRGLDPYKFGGMRAELWAAEIEDNFGVAAELSSDAGKGEG